MLNRFKNLVEDLGYLYRYYRMKDSEMTSIMKYVVHVTSEYATLLEQYLSIKRQLEKESSDVYNSLNN